MERGPSGETWIQPQSTPISNREGNLTFEVFPSSGRLGGSTGTEEDEGTVVILAFWSGVKREVGLRYSCDVWCMGGGWSSVRLRTTGVHTRSRLTDDDLGKTKREGYVSRKESVEQRDVVTPLSTL